MQKAIRNTSGKPTTVENLDKRLDARERDSRKTGVDAVVKSTDSNAEARAKAEKLDRDQEANRVAQARAEQSQNSADDKETEFNVRQG
jgi:hypothetical protein